jgi:CDP-paratose 2-epimerase
MKCAVLGWPYTVHGYLGKQVRDNIHSEDFVAAIAEIVREPRFGAVYNMGGGRQSNCSLLEALTLCEEITGEPVNWSYSEANRIGDHMWWISDLTAFRRDYPGWQLQHSVRSILKEIYEFGAERWSTFSS